MLDVRCSTFSRGRQLAAAYGLMLLVAAAACADVRLPSFFSDHMVLQRGIPVAIWGGADPGEAVSVTAGDAGPVSTTADANGNWRVELTAMPAGGPIALIVKGKNTITINDVLVGEVWLCSGQSNMQFGLRASDNGAAEVAAANHPRIRELTVPRRAEPLPVDDLNAQWLVCSPQTAGGFTAVGYFFGRELLEKLDVPIGLIHSSWGGTMIDPWTPPCGWAAQPSLAETYKQIRLSDPATPEHKAGLSAYLEQLDNWMGKAREAVTSGKALAPSPPYPDMLKPITQKGEARQQPTALYNGMIHALVGYGMRGAIWYQGESNHVEGMRYADKMKALIGGWRQLWKIGDFPFYYVQIAPFKYGDEDPATLACFWEAQTAALAIPHTGMAVINDIGNINDIHPKNKQDVGKRLALLALANDYGQTGLVCSGPTFKALSPEGHTLRVTFGNVGGGLVSRDGKPLTDFEVIGMDTDFMPATATIDGDSVILSSEAVPEPLAMRFAWHKLATPNLMNREGLPAGPFRAGKVPERDYLSMNVPEAADYELVYDLNLDRLKRDIVYDVDNSKAVKRPFDRVAYFLELRKARGKIEYVYVSMDAFSTDPAKLGIPAVDTHTSFHTPVANMTVLSNVGGVKTGAGLAGNIEFWSNNYVTENAFNVPGAAGDVYDFGDQPCDPADGYGCMQVHNTAAGQTVFAVNNWKAGPRAADIGIGNSTGKTRDWTFMSNAGGYTVKRLRVLVHTK